MVNQIEWYIEKQKSPQKEILQETRKIFKDTLPNANEEFKWGVITFSDGKFYIAAMKDRVHVGFAISGLSNDELALFEGNGKTMRHIKISAIDSIDAPRLVKLIRMVDLKSKCESC